MKVCSVCNRKFNESSKYCSPSCKGRAAIAARYNQNISENIHLICKFCQDPYSVPPCRIKKGRNSKYCSRLCHNRANAKAISTDRIGEKHPMFGKKFTLVPRVTLLCNFCKKQYQIREKLKQESKFCSKNCFAFYRQKRLKNSRRLWIYESIKLFGYGCERCKTQDDRIEVHHIDRNRNNNPKDGSNWMRLCRKCHYFIHKITLERAPIISKEEFLTI